MSAPTEADSVSDVRRGVDGVIVRGGSAVHDAARQLCAEPLPTDLRAVRAGAVYVAEEGDWTPQTVRN